ncbi:unnamed protein product [Ambrosiozyma monospora]|uniref:Unnamed protein product n=1 Tax=Ambrosiozyma monospora TaxID=43982 RepID=A0ACB5T5H0_AMBMO|nr:unnamed protein product [Ambrosiozyma monospora]
MKTEFYSDFQIHGETRRNSILDSPEFPASIADIGMYFHSLELTSKGALSDHLDIFPNLEEACLSPHNVSFDPIFRLQNNSLKKLTIVGSLKRGKNHKDLLLYPNKLTNLTKLKISKCRLDYKIFDNLPDTIHTLTLSDCIFNEDNPRSRLKIPTSLQRLNLKNTCPKIDPSARLNNSPGVQLNLSWTSSARCLDFDGLSKIITSSARWVREIRFTPPDCFPDYVTIARVDNKDDSYCFSIQFGEDITSYFKKAYYEKLYYLYVKVSHKLYSTVLKEMAVVCMECFERKYSDVGGGSGGFQQHMSYEGKLRARLKFESSLSWNLSMIETKTPFASVVN